MATLDDLGIGDDTLVFFTSDNGPHHEGGRGFDPDFFDSNGPLRGIKRDLYEGGIRVPMIARWPGHVPAGVVSDQVWAFWDVLPTLAELAGASGAVPDDIDGLSVLPTLLGPEAAGHPQQEHELLYWEFHEGPSSKQAARMGDWKGVRLSPDGPLELYDLAEDLGEMVDIAADHPEVVATITDAIDARPLRVRRLAASHRPSGAGTALRPAPARRASIGVAPAAVQAGAGAGSRSRWKREDGVKGSGGEWPRASASQVSTHRAQAIGERASSRRSAWSGGGGGEGRGPVREGWISRPSEARL